MQYKHIHFVGIKGVGMTPLAIIAKEAGITVTGSDLGEEFITDAALKLSGITPFVAFSPEHIRGADLIITTGAHGGLENIECTSAAAQNIPILLQGKAVGEYMQGEIFGRSFTGISVTGTHGKTTTTAMIATILKEAQMDPSYVVGTSDIPSLGGAGHFGTGEYFVAEADEYATDPKFDRTPKFLWQKPQILVINNIEHDHPDLYPTLEDVVAAFRMLIKQLPEESLIVGNGDDPTVRKLLSEIDKKSVTVGFGETNTFRVQKMEQHGATARFSVDQIGELEVGVFGEHNIMNASVAAVVAYEIGIEREQLLGGLKAFTGSKRRMEYLGRLTTGALVYDDYAHNPTKIRKTLEAFKEAFPHKKIICVFQPHTYSRTKTLFEEFVHSFTAADEVIMAPIYASMREAADPTVSSEKLVAEMQKIQSSVLYLESFPRIIEYLKHQQLSEDIVLVTMGAGDIYKVVDGLDLVR